MKITVEMRVQWLRDNGYSKPYSAPPDRLIDACIRAAIIATKPSRRGRK